MTTIIHTAVVVATILAVMLGIFALSKWLNRNPTQVRYRNEWVD